MPDFRYSPKTFKNDVFTKTGCTRLIRARRQPQRITKGRKGLEKQAASPQRCKAKSAPKRAIAGLDKPSNRP